MAGLRRLPSGSAWLYAALLLGIFAAAAIAGYVYQYEPARDRIVLQVDRSVPPSDHRIVSGTVVEVSGERLVIDQDGRRVELTVPAGVPVEDLVRSADPLAPGTPVNVGAEQTDFGLVLTGVVGIEDGRVGDAP